MRFIVLKKYVLRENRTFKKSNDTSKKSNADYGKVGGIDGSKLLFYIDL